MRICVYGAGSTKIKSKYIDESYRLGEEIAKRGHSLVFGGGSTGVMGAVSKGALDNNGKVIGIAPKWMEKFEGICRECDEFIYTESMKERKNLFLEKSDAFIIAPGGIGTLEELFEIITWKQLGLYPKPIVILNTNGFFDKVLSFLDQLIEQNFMREEHKKMWKVVDKAEEILPAIRSFEAWDNSFRKIAAIK